MELLFVYGTLRDAAVQRRVYGREVPSKPDTLYGYRRSQVWSGDDFYPIAVLDVEGMIDGFVLSLTDDEMARGDAYEGDEYRRLRVTLRSGTEAWVYCE